MKKDKIEIIIKLLILFDIIVLIAFIIFKNNAREIPRKDTNELLEERNR